ncbi:MAG: hypothetical protein J0M16_04315, partial [Gammaproteobacteria bacterium]|nr:hypothetical protein [Gammaproteobacteria bacterium]
MRQPGFLRIVVTAVLAGMVGLQWLLPPDREPGRRRPPPPRHEQGRRPEPDRWPETRVPVRFAVVPNATDPAGGEEPARSRSLDQPDIFMRDNPPAEWTSGTAFAVGSGG